ncbi:YbfB/YjiJ family MFS transporter [Limnobacter sp.]|uniref:YbfB/YjiJ family MFS transporter n=1 Tax=Limnobacter sp. TaxID=2003368 RepID=UPI003518F4E3
MTLQRWQAIAAGISSLILTVGLARFSYTPLLPIMRQQADLSAFDGGWLATVNYMGYITGALLASTLGNLEWKYIMYRVGLVVAVLSTAGMGMTTDVSAWVVLRFVSGVSSTAGMLLASGLIMNWLARRGLKTELGLHFAGAGMGLVLSGLAVMAMVDHLQWDQQWWALGALGVLFFVPAWVWMPKPAKAGTPQAFVDPVPPPSSRWMRLMLGAYFCAGFGYVISATFVVAIAESLPELKGQGPWVWVVVGLAAIPSTFVWDRVARLTGVFEALVAAYLLQIISIVMAALLDGYWANMCSAVLFGGTFAGIVNLTLSIAGRKFPINPSKAMARMTLSYGVSQIAAPALAGLIAEKTGSYRGSLYLAAGLMVAGVYMVWLLKNESEA